MGEINKSNNNSKYHTIFNEYIEGAFKASIGVKVTKKDQWINISIAIFNGRTFKTKTGNGMSIQLRPQDVKKLIQKLQYASDLQSREFNKPKEPNPELDAIIDELK